MAWTIVLLAVFVPTVGKSQMPPPKETAPEGFYVTPSLSVGEVYDDNLFFAPASQREEDWFTRVSPGILAGYQSTPLTLVGRYTFDSEFYKKHPELTTAQMRQNGSIELKSKQSPSLSLSAIGAYFQTRTPFELNTLTGVAVRRIRADRYSANPAFEYRPDPLTKATGDYLYSKDLMVGFITIDSHITNLGLDRRITAHDTVGPGYIGRHFEFAGFGSTTSHAFTLGWSRDLTSHTKVSLRAGPRFIAGALDSEPEALASISYKLGRRALSFTYSNILTTVIGQAGVAKTESFGIDGSYEFLEHLKLSVAPTLYKITSQTFKITVYALNFEGTYQMTDALALKGSYQFSFMEGGFNPLTGPAGGDVGILHNIFWFRFVLSFPERLG